MSSTVKLSGSSPEGSGSACLLNGFDCGSLIRIDERSYAATRPLNDDRQNSLDLCLSSRGDVPLMPSVA